MHFMLYLLSPIFISNKHANITSWDLRMLVQHYMSILEQFTHASEQK
jgi:hypothetical protein